MSVCASPLMVLFESWTPVSGRLVVMWQLSKLLLVAILDTLPILSSVDSSDAFDSMEQLFSAEPTLLLFPDVDAEDLL